ncbi:MAG: pyridoxamine 5'-phosphate oxidase family protein [Actinomycetota bacterium]|nr:pyridoxamine 5'-phosphate oxidase family protein [Actinomycetota bacterium]
MPTLPLPDPGPPFEDFVGERHLAALTLVRPNGYPHTTPVGFTWDRGTGSALIITWSGSVKVRLLEAGQLRGSICQVDGGRWLTIEGVARVTSDPGSCANAVAAYAARYRPPKDRGDERRVVVIEATRLLASASLVTVGPPGANG